MDPKGSTPDNNTQGDLEDHSPQNDTSAEIVDNNQPSDEDDNRLFDYEEQQDDQSDDAPSQTTQTDDDTQDADQTDQSGDTGVDPELERWATSQNISLQTETEIKLAKRLRDTQKMAHDKAAEAKQKFNEASSEATSGDTTKAIEAKLARIEFFDANPDARELEGEMFDYAVNILDSGDKAGFAYYQTPQGWKQLYKIVKANKAEVQSEDSYTTGREDERKNLAKKQQAGAPKQNANSSAMQGNGSLIDKLEKMSATEYNAYLREHPEIDPFKL